MEILTQTFAPPAGVVDKLTPKFEFLRLGPDAMGPLFQTNQWHDFGQRKLYGIRFGHFGAFMDERWRHSDFTWGRLDTVHHLLPVLLGKGIDHSDVEETLHRAILQVEASPGSDDDQVKQMESRLLELKKKDKELLDGKKLKILRSAGDSAVRALAPHGWFIQWIGRQIVHWRLKKWSK